MSEGLMQKVGNPFVHLHVHTEFSLLDGFCRIDKLVERVKQLEMPAVAITDHGVLCGAVDFHQKATSAGIKPIIGMESYMAARGMKDRDPAQDSRSFHLLLLAENDVGYRNLMKIATASQLDGLYYKPRIDHDFLEAHSEGLICTTGCLSGEIPRALASGQMKKAIVLIDWYFDVFGTDRFFFELQGHDIPELQTVNKALIDLAPRYSANFVATNDVHYLRHEDASLQDILLCVQTGAARQDQDRMKMSGDTYYLRSYEEMRELFGDVPGALENTLLIADRCNVDLDFKGYHLPEFDVPDGYSLVGYLREKCEEGLVLRYGDRANDQSVRSRIDHELEIIHQMGFDAYFLIVWDICRFAEEKGFWFNTRGSAAGSIVAYSLGITSVDPLEHDLIFERFLNPERVSMPDIDLDIQDDKRQYLINYVADKYGVDHVAQIITFGSMGSRGAVRDVGRVLDIPIHDVDRIAKKMPWSNKDMRIMQAVEETPYLKEEYEKNQSVREMVDIAAEMEGLRRNAGTHAAGVVITPGPLDEYIPLHRPIGNQKDGTINALTQFEMNTLDRMGMLKVDFLGLSTLTAMSQACDMVLDRHGVDLDLASIPLDDESCYQLLGRGEVAGIFQLESAGMRRYLMEMKPTKLEHVIAMVALYRPGPMDFIPDYIARMQGKESIEYRHEMLEPIFEETYGKPVYQEQIMRAAVELGGYTAGEADTLRKAISKKNAKNLLKHEEKFVKGAVNRGIEEEIAREIFEDWKAFARYGFNRAHAAAYGIIAVKTAYLKANFPIEYMCALLSVYRDNSGKVGSLINECRRMEINVLPPSVNHSSLYFTIENNDDGEEAIRFGLGAIKNVGDSAAKVVLGARRTDNIFGSLEDFYHRVDLKKVGNRAFESLIRVGALDDFGSRNELLSKSKETVKASTNLHKTITDGQLTLFSGENNIARQDNGNGRSETVIPEKQMLDWERELLGVYVSAHPVAMKMEILSKLITHYSDEIQEEPDNELVIVAGEVVKLRTYITKNDEEMAFGTLEDLKGEMDVVLFPKLWSSIKSWITEGKIVVAKGNIDRKRGDPQILVEKITDEIERVTTPETRKAAIHA